MIGTIKKLIALLTAKQKRRALVLLLLMAIGMLLETCSVGLLVPLLAFMSQNNLIDHYPQMQALSLYLGNPTKPQFLMIIMFLLVIVYACKTLYLAVLSWMQARFVFKLQENLAQRLFAGYLHQPYTFHLQRNSSQLIQTVANETGQFSRGAMLPAMILLTEGMVLVGIGALLLLIEPFGAMVVMVILSIAGGSFYKYSRARSLRWGKARQFHEGMSIQHLQQGLGGAKEVKLLGREASFLARFSQHNSVSTSMWERQTTLQAMPRLWLEFLSVLGLGALVGILVLRGASIESFIPTLGLFAAAAFRLMPSFNRVLTSIQNLRFALPITNRLVDELALFTQTESAVKSGDLEFKRELRLNSVSYTYPGSQEPVLDDLNATIRYGTTVGIVGSSGAGKSTLVDVVLGLLKPTQGNVTLDGVDIQSNPKWWMSNIGYVSQHIYLMDDTLRNNIAFGVPDAEIDNDAVWRSLKSAQLEDFVTDMPDGIETIVGERGVKLSGGQRQRIGIARALYNDPPVLVLDEATSALDTQTEKGVMDAVKKLHGEKTIIIIAHRLSTLDQCDSILQVAKGKVVNQYNNLEVQHYINAAHTDN